MMGVRLLDGKIVLMEDDEAIELIAKGEAEEVPMHANVEPDNVVTESGCKTY